MRAPAPAVATAERILELAKKAEILYKSQNPAEQRRFLETELSNCTFDAGSLCAVTLSHSTCSFTGTKLGNGGPCGTTFGTTSLERSLVWVPIVDDAPHPHE